MWKKDGEFKYTIGDLDQVVDERGSTFLALRKIAWGYSADDKPEEDKFKLDLRKYYIDKEGREKMAGGVSFLTEEGPHELTNVLVQNGYGDTNKLCEALINRPDYANQLLDFDKGYYEDGEYIDLRAVLGDDTNAASD